jgi:two-component system phosphate regulon sensor histidine kinase PhoR
MKYEWRKATQRTLLGFVAAVVIGLLFDVLAWSLALTGITYTLWHYLQLHKLQSWLDRSEVSDPPYGYGIWGAVFDDVYRLQLRQRKSKKRLKSVIRRVQESTSAMRDGVIMLNNYAELEWWNDASGNLLGLKDPEDIGMPITNIVREPDFKAYFDEGKYDTPLELTSPIHQDQVLQIHITLFGKKDRLIVCRDISQIKQLETMRQNFIGNASHELRTPLTVIAGYLETLIEYEDSIPEMWRRPLHQMHKQSDRMQGLIEDLLILSRLENNDNEDSQSTVSIKPLLTGIQGHARALSAGKHTITLECEDFNIKGNATELSSAFSNLIFNAVKYTPEGGEIEIKWHKNKHRIYLDVVDNGLGIDPIHISRLTERFYRADASRHSETGGSGLGLAIVKHALLRHEGHLEIQSILGKGSTFSCELPLSRQSEVG